MQRMYKSKNWSLKIGALNGAGLRKNLRSCVGLGGNERIVCHGALPWPLGSTDNSKSAGPGMFNPIIRGWLKYYGNYYRSALYPLCDHLIRLLKRWAMRKFKRLRGRQKTCSPLAQAA
jgi:Group II intron, maturase-specific domain